MFNDTKFLLTLYGHISSVVELYVTSSRQSKTKPEHPEKNWNEFRAKSYCIHGFSLQLLSSI